MIRIKKTFFHSLLWRLLAPVILVGFTTSVILNYYLVPPLVEEIERRVDKTISYSAEKALNICEERLNDLLDLRMEENSQMNKASQNEALLEIREVSNVFSNIRLIVFSPDGRIIGSSFDLKYAISANDLSMIIINREDIRNISASTLLGNRIFFSERYFPFWRWHIISFIPENEYLSPIHKTKNIIRLGTFGTLSVVVITVILLFYYRINSPLTKIMSTTENVRKGSFSVTGMSGQGEIQQVAVAFDHMIEKLQRDSKEREQILRELSESEEKYRILSEHSFALVAVLQGDTFVYSNAAAADFFEMKEGTLENININDLLDRDANRQFYGCIANLQERKVGIEHFELTVTSSTGEKKYLEALATATTYEGKWSVLLHALDISTRKQMEEEQEILREKAMRGERMEMLGTLAGGVAHDLNNILGGIVGYPGLLMAKMDKYDQMYDSLNMIKKSGEKAATIVQDLLTLTRRGVVVTEVVNFYDIITEYSTSPEHKYLENVFPQVTVEITISKNLMNVKGSKHHLSTALMNLVSNGAEAISGSGIVTIAAENKYLDKPLAGFETIEEGEYVCVSVIDTGQGICETNLKRIFEPFYTKKVMGRSGTGLGMSVVWGTVKDHGGYIEVESAEGQGTRFTLFFPATRQNRTQQEEGKEIPGPVGNGETVLVVDDVEEQRIIASAMLKDLGFHVDVAKSGEDGVMKASKTSYELLLLDMIMDPGMDGLDTLKEILQINPHQKTIIVSGFSETDRVSQCMHLGALAYVKKPYSVKTLSQVLRKAMSDKKINS